MSGEEAEKGAVAPGQLADLAVLSSDYFSVPEEAIKGIESVLTVVGGKVVYAKGAFAPFSPPPLPVAPDWSPVGVYGGYHGGTQGASAQGHPLRSTPRSSQGFSLHGLVHRLFEGAPRRGEEDPIWGTGCACWAF